MSESLDEQVDSLQRRLPGARVVVSPYRICPIGAHSDHQGGPVLGMAVSAYTLLAFTPASGSTVALESDNFEGTVRFDLERAEAERPEAWGRYAHAAALALSPRLPALPRGFVGRVTGTLPGGGLSSSASVVLAYLLALANVNEIALEPKDLVDLALRAEKGYVGVQVGILDPASISGARRDHLLAIDTKNREWECVALGQRAPAYRILVAFSGVTRNLSGTDYNRRVEECFGAARKLAAACGREDVEGLHDLDESALEEHGDVLLEAEARRARHFFTERARVRKGLERWRAGDLESFGDLMNASCESSISNWESGSPEILRIQHALLESSGTFGARFAGAGFGGSVVALVAEGSAPDVARRLERDGLARVFLVESEDGPRIR